jgi:hypothetical protein
LSDLPKHSAFVQTWRNPAKLAAYLQWQREFAEAQRGVQS